MKTKQIFGFVVAAMIALFAVSSVMALQVSIGTVSVNDVDLSVGSTTVIAGSPGDTVPLTVRLQAGTDAADVKVKATIGDSSSVSTSRFDVLNGSTYVKHLSVVLPNVEDIDGLNESWTLKVTVSDKVGEEVTSTYNIRMQREAHALQFLQADAPMKAAAGEIIAIDVVLENIGARDADNAFVTVSIPELGVSKKAYFGDLVSYDNHDSNDNEDARERRVYLAIPSDAKSGDYALNVQASNYDTSASVKKVISITGLATATNSTAITATSSDKEGIPTSIIVLTVVLVIIFVVLLVVLIVLLTKKPSEKSEDFSESYY